MKKFIAALMIGLSAFSPSYSVFANDAVGISDADVMKILKAKEIVKSMVNFPDTLVFYNLYTKVSGNTVTLKFSCKNAFGVQETFTKDITVN